MIVTDTPWTIALAMSWLIDQIDEPGQGPREDHQPDGALRRQHALAPVDA